MLKAQIQILRTDVSILSICSTKEILQNECSALKSLDFCIDSMSSIACLDLLVVAIEDAGIASARNSNFRVE